MGEITKLASELQIQFDEIKVEVEPQSHSKESIVVFVNLGFGQEVTKGNLAEFLVEEAGMNASDVKNVVVEKIIIRVSKFLSVMKSSCLST